MNIRNLVLMTMALIISFPLQAGLIFTIDEPGIQHSSVSGTKLVETFDDWSRGRVHSNQSSEFGEYHVQGRPKVLSARLWGGADGVGNYLFIQPKYKTAMTLVFNNPVAYFGFWWSAGDRGNLLEVKTLTDIYSFTTRTIFETIDNLKPYRGNPTTNFLGQNRGEPYGYINLFAQSDDYKVESIKFYGSNFETDNHTVAYESQDTRGTRIAVISEPHTLILFMVLLIPLLYFSYRRKRISSSKETLNHTHSR